MEEAIKTGLDFLFGPAIIIESIILPIAFVMHLFSLFIIMKYTPNYMREYRKYLLAVQCSLIIWDLSMGILFRPTFFFPSMASGCAGLLSHYFHLNCNIQCSFMFFAICMTFTVMTTALLYKRFQMAPPGSSMLMERRHKMLLNALGMITQLAATLFLYFGGLESGEIIIDDPRLEYVTTINYQLNTMITLWFISVITFGVWKLLLCTKFILMVFVHLAKSNGRLSEKTYEMQSYFAKTLVLQLAGTLLSFYIPLLICFVAQYFNFLNAGFLYYLSQLPLFHSTVYTTILLTKTPVYRQAICSLFGLRKNRSTSIISPDSIHIETKEAST